jgi:hypothetical protein
MESFFLSETLKYLYLLFDEENILHTGFRDHIFTTQAHIFPLLPHFHDRLESSDLSSVTSDLSTIAPRMCPRPVERKTIT